MKPRLWPVLLASGIGLVVLLWLGFWQVERLAWKTAQIAKLDLELSGEALDPWQSPATQSPFRAGAKLRLTGRFEGIALRKIATLKGGPGFEIIQGFTLDRGGSILVVRGVAGEGQTVPAVVTTVEIIGIIKEHVDGQGLFDPDNEPRANRWHWWDLPAMALAASDIPPHYTTGALHLLPGSPGSEDLHVDPPKANLRNNHLGYAITWFGLAAVLVVVTGVFLLQRSRQS